MIAVEVKYLQRAITPRWRWVLMRLMFWRYRLVIPGILVRRISRYG